MTSSYQCALCKHYKGNLSCKAFEKIPEDIYTGEVSHKKPYPGDNGIRFEPIEKKSKANASRD